ncbi:bombesin receptor subtype-3-like [Periplaneta americana]|uniref:bombesin receptor subtype-3-like n=1 Tax=Periplaneta americana TaxID=6978 RepID=UPI0037E7E42F
MTNLTALFLTNNRIETLEVGIFNGLTSLDYLHLNHNLLNSFKSDAFIGLKNLSTLWLSRNRLSTLHPDVFIHLTELKYLYLDGNEELQTPNNSSFLNIQTVEELDISDCNISRIIAISFENATNLRVLDLTNNHMKIIDENIFRVLSKSTDLLLYGNPLECDCGLLETWRWGQEHDIKVAEYSGILCESPEQVSGMWWGVLGKAQCKNGSITFQEGYKAVVQNFINRFNGLFYAQNIFLEYVQPLIYTLLFIFGTIGNVIVLVAIICNSEMHTVPNVYIMNLAVSDLILLTMNTILSYIHAQSESWELGEVCCRMFGFFRHSSIGVSAYLISVMSIQRYQVISRPLHNRRQSMTRIGTIATILGVWAICSLFAIPYTLATHVANSSCNIYNSWKYYQKVVVFELLVFCFLPLGVTACMYCLAARHLMRSTNIVSEEIHKQANMRRNSARIVLSLTIVFVFSLLPYHVFLTCMVRDDFDYTLEMIFIDIITTYLLVFISCFNPVALCCSSKCYRRYFKHYLLKCCRGKIPTTADNAKKCVDE